MIEQLAPRSLDRHRLHFATVAGQPPALDQTALGEQLDGVTVCLAVERHRQIELARVHAERRAGDGHPLRVAGQLELRRRRLELLEHKLAVAQDVDLAAFHAPVDAARHLEDFVRAEVEPRQHVATPLDDIGVARVVDHHGVEAADVEG